MRYPLESWNPWPPLGSPIIASPLQSFCEVAWSWLSWPTKTVAWTAVASSLFEHPSRHTLFFVEYDCRLAWQVMTWLDSSTRTLETPFKTNRWSNHHFHVMSTQERFDLRVELHRPPHGAWPHAGSDIDVLSMPTPRRVTCLQLKCEVMKPTTRSLLWVAIQQYINWSAVKASAAPRSVKSPVYNTRAGEAVLETWA